MYGIIEEEVKLGDGGDTGITEWASVVLTEREYTGCGTSLHLGLGGSMVIYTCKTSSSCKLKICACYTSAFYTTVKTLNVIT